MAITLVTRAGNGAPLTANQFDSNMGIIQTQVNLNSTDIAALQSTRVTSTALNAYFEGISSGKQQVDWARVVNKPTQFTNPGAFKANKTDADQTISSSGGSLIPHFNTELFDYGSNYDPTAYLFTVPITGVYMIGYSVQVALSSGTPTGISIISNIQVNGANLDQATFDNSGTGTRIYKSATLLPLVAADNVRILLDFTFTGTATWLVQTTNTSFWGQRINTST